MRFQDRIAENRSLAEIYSQMELQTPMGRQLLRDTELSASKAWIENQWAQMDECSAFWQAQTENARHAFLCDLHSICDISGSLRLLDRGETLDDVALFEIKTFCLGVKRVKKRFDSRLMPIADLKDIVAILDPEGLELWQFYIYSAYSETLAQRRKEWEAAKASQDEKAAHALYLQTLELEDGIRRNLCIRLRVYIPKLTSAIRAIAMQDVALSKAILSEKLSLSKVEICDEPALSYQGLFHPWVKPLMLNRNQRYQDIDVEIGGEVFLVTGANMAGKTMILKTLALNQLLLQYGFPLGCAAGRVCLVEDVLCSIGDGQNEQQGLSSFAWEIKTLDNILKTIRQGGRYLVLADELARTTNPVEGKKLVEGFIKVCSKFPSLTVVTTHYSNIAVPCRRMRVKGFKAERLTPPIDIDRISDHIDYSLIEDLSGEAPSEALNLCRLLAIDPEWIDYCSNAD